MPIFGQDSTLLARYRRGESAALERIYRHYVRGLDGYFRLLAQRSGALELGQASAVADLLQETFIRALSPAARAAFDGGEFSPYLNAIARNCFCDALRKRRVESRVSPDDLPLAAEPHDAEGDTEDLRVLRAYVEGLAPGLRGVYERRFVQGLSQEAACRELGVTRRTLRTSEEHLRRGLRRSLLLDRLRRSGAATPSAGEVEHAKT
jgi:RNA polymerase sigma-70 factor (ECF subfamily)